MRLAFQQIEPLWVTDKPHAEHQSYIIRVENRNTGRLSIFAGSADSDSRVCKENSSLLNIPLLMYLVMPNKPQA